MRVENQNPTAMTIGRKLTALMIAMTLVVVASLTAYLAHRQIDAAEQELARKANAYAALVAQAVRSAVAFGDQETAREIFDAVTIDDDVEGIALYRQDGSVLHQRGMLSSLAERGRVGVTRSQTVVMAEQIIALVPVTSLEGPRGSLAIQLSTADLGAMRTDVVRQAATAGLLAALLGIGLSTFLARHFARRIAAIARSTERMAGADLSPLSIDDASADEIGQLARGFNRMAARITELVTEIRENAATEQQRLSTVVAERTRGLAERNRAMRLVLDNVAQGLVMVDRDGVMRGEHSRALETWFGPAPASGTVWDLFATASRDFAELSELAWEQVVDGLLPEALALDTMPSSIEADGRTCSVAYLPCEADDGGYLVVVSDITARIDRERAEGERRETGALFARMLTDRAGTTEFYRETESLLADLLGGNVDDETARRTIHTIKGNAALFGLETLARACHAVEDRIGERGRVVEQDAHAINAAWTRATTRLGAALVGMTQSVEVARDDIEALACGLRQRRPHDELRAWVDRWSDERVAKRLHRFGEYAELLAQRLGKAPLRVIVDAADVRLPAQSWAPFWVAFQHLIRNAVDHGVASAEERARAGKHESATLKLTCALTGTDMCIAVEDDGAGIDWPAIARRAHALGRPAASQCDLEEALFGHGLTTKETVTATSGRGVGLAALRHACGMSGGRVIVTSTAGQGTRFEVRWPSHTKRHAQPSTSGTDNQRKSA